MRQFDIRKFQFQLIKEAPNGRQSLAHNVLGVVYAVGYAVFDPRTDTNLDALQKRADQNMYENKKQLKTFSYR